LGLDGVQSVFETFPEENEDERKTETNDKSRVQNSLLSEPPKWEKSAVLPAWFKENVALHKEQRLALNETKWKDQRYLIMRCLDEHLSSMRSLDIDDKCGGASDHLQSVPTLLVLANITRRMLFIKWNSWCHQMEVSTGLFPIGSINTWTFESFPWPRGTHRGLFKMPRHLYG
jgi:hypothetical protein